MDYKKAGELIVKAAIMDGGETTIRPVKNLGYKPAIEVDMQRGKTSCSSIIDLQVCKEHENGEEMLMHVLKSNLFRLLQSQYDI